MDVILEGDQMFWTDLWDHQSDERDPSLFQFLLDVLEYVEVTLPTQCSEYHTHFFDVLGLFNRLIPILQHLDLIIFLYGELLIIWRVLIELCWWILDHDRLEMEATITDEDDEILDATILW